LSGEFEVLWSYVLEYENSRNPFETRRDSVQSWKEVASKSIRETEEIISCAEALMVHGIKLYDSLHIACAYVGGCDYFLTVDKQLLGKSISEIKVCNPIDFIRELEEL